MYATPASGSGPNSNDLNDYLLGKKRVDKILIGDENQSVSVLLIFYHRDFSPSSYQLGASHKNFIATQHANTIRDTAAKVREDPLFLIKQQEQAALQALRENPLRFKELQERNGLAPKSEKVKRHKKRKHRSGSPDRRDNRRKRLRSRSYSPHFDKNHERSSRRERSPRRHGRDSRSPHRSQEESRSSSDRGRDEDSRSLRGFFLHSPRRSDLVSIPVGLYRHTQTKRDSPDSYEHSNRSPRDAGTGEAESSSVKEEEKSIEPNRADRLAAMVSNASEANKEREKRLASRLAEERAELKSEQQLRTKSGGSSSFITNQQKRVFGGMDGGLGDYMRRGKIGLVVERD